MLQSRTKVLFNAAFAALALAALGVWLTPESSAQSSAAQGTFETIRVHGSALEGNLEGDSPDREVLVYLPPSYVSDPTRHYPVVYFLHGYGSTAQGYWNLMQVPEASDRVMSDDVQDMIVVLPDANSKYNGSMYSNSPTTGDWETFIAHDLVDYIDSHYRTIPARESRGLVGHSMGGYGTLRVAMRYPEVYSAIYAMSSCCLLNLPQAGNPNQAKGKGPAAKGAPGAKGKGPAPKGKGKGKGKGNAFALAGQAQAAAWSPNPSNPPDYFDNYMTDGKLDPLVAARWAANSPTVMVNQHVPALRSFEAFMIDIGRSDGLFASNGQLEAELSRLKIPHEYETYDGNHGNRVKERYASKVLPFFSRHLQGE